MFTDIRSKRVVLIAHCLLNQNSISDGTAVYPAAFRDVIKILLDAEVGICQLPCPELCCLGLDRGNVYGADMPVTVENSRIRQEMQKPETNTVLMSLADYAMVQISEYQKHGFDIVGIIGANRSPSCGVDTTSVDGMEAEGKGVFMAELAKRLSAEHLKIPMIGLKSTDDVVAKINAIL